MVSRFKVGSVIFTCCNVVVLVALIAFPITAEAFSRRAIVQKWDRTRLRCTRLRHTRLRHPTTAKLTRHRSRRRQFRSLPHSCCWARPRSIRHLLPDQAIPWARCVPRERQVNSPGAWCPRWYHCTLTAGSQASEAGPFIPRRRVSFRPV